MTTKPNSISPVTAMVTLPPIDERQKEDSQVMGAKTIRKRRFECNNELHRAMQTAFGKVFGDRLAEHPIEMTRAVEQSGRFLSSIYETDYRDMTRETWRRARASFDQAYEEFKGHLITAWDTLEDKA